MDRIIIDVREPEEYDRGHVPGAINIPPNEIMAGASKLNEVPKDTELVLYCVSGSRITNLVNGINQHHVTAKYL